MSFLRRPLTEPEAEQVHDALTDARVEGLFEDDALVFVIMPDQAPAHEGGVPGVLRRAEKDGERCSAVLAHGPGHQSTTRCERTGPHEVHRAIYGSARQEATWRDGSYTNQLRKQGIDFNPKSYPENMAMTGFFDEPPQEDES